MFNAVQRGVKRGFTEIHILFKRTRQGTSLPAGRVFRSTFTMMRDPAHQRSRLTGTHQVEGAPAEKSADQHHAEANKEIDRIINTRPVGVHLTHQRKVVDFQRPWGTC